MNESTNRGREWDDAKCDELAAFDSSRDPKEFLPQIYREASNGNQHPANQVAKTLAKCSALFVRLSADQTRASKRLERLTVGLFVLTVAIVGLSVALLYYTIELHKDAKNADNYTHQGNLGR